MKQLLLLLLLTPQLCIGQISWQKFGGGIQPGLINSAYVYNNVTNDILLGTDSDGILFSKDGGTSWTPVNNGLPGGSSITSIDIHVSSGRIILVASGVVYISNSNLLSSSITWSELNNWNQLFSNANLVFVDSNDKIWSFSKTSAYVTTLAGTTWTNTSLSGVSGISNVCLNGNGYPSVSWLYGTADYNGTSWSVSNLASSLLQDVNNQTVTNYKISAGGISYYGSSNGVFKYSSGFINVSHNLPTVPYTASVTAPLKINDVLDVNGDLYVATQDVSTSKKEGNIYKLPSGTSTWTKLGNGLPQNIVKYSKIFLTTNGNLYALGTEGLFKSTDGGANWTSLTQNAAVNSGVRSFAFLNDGSIVAATLTGKLFLGDASGANWQNITSALLSGSLGHVKADGNNVIYASAGFAPSGLSSSTAGLFYSKDLGVTWAKAFPANRASLIDINITSLNEAFFGGNFDPSPDGMSIHFSTDGGSTWNVKSVNNGAAGSIFSANKMSNGYLIAGSETSGVLRSTDNGSTFQSITNTTGKAGNVSRVDIAPWGDLFISFDYTRGMYFVTSSSLNSVSPSAAQLNNYPALTNTTDVVFGNANNIYVATDKGFLSSSDNGNTFVTGNSGLNQTKILRLAVNQFDGYLYLANAEGLFRSTTTVITPGVVKANQTITFNAIPVKSVGDPAFNLNATTTSGLSVSYSSSNPSVATVSGNVVTIVGAGSTDITALQAGSVNYNPAANVVQTLVVTVTTGIEEWARSGVFPNPTNAFTTIRLNSLTRTHELVVYDIQGQKIEIPITETGDSEIQLDFSKLPNGLYILSFKDGHTVKVVKEN